MLDTLTLLVVLIVSTLLMAGALCITFVGHFKGGLGQWTGSLIVHSLAWLMIAGADRVPDFASTGLATSLLVFGWSLQVGALLTFHNLRTPKWLLYGPAAIAFLFALAFLKDDRVRLAIGGFIFGFAQLLTFCGLLYYRVAAERRTRFLLAASYCVMAAGLLWLAFTAWFEPEAILPTFGVRPAPGASLLAFYAVTISSSFAFLLMHKERADRETYELATTDSLTGVYNRRTFKELAEPQLSRCRRARTPVSVLMLDLDHFKRVNDTHGHLAGDDVIAAFAGLIKSCLRKEDLLARYGGEEFVVLLPGSSQTAAKALAERIRDCVAKTAMRAGDQEIHVTVSVGLTSETGQKLPSLEAMLGRADEALYAAKAQGRNQVVMRSMEEPERRADVLAVEGAELKA